MNGRLSKERLNLGNPIAIVVPLVGKGLFADSLQRVVPGCEACGGQVVQHFRNSGDCIFAFQKTGGAPFPSCVPFSGGARLRKIALWSELPRKVV